MSSAPWHAGRGGRQSLASRLALLGRVVEPLNARAEAARRSSIVPACWMVWRRWSERPQRRSYHCASVSRRPRVRCIRNRHAMRRAVWTGVLCMLMSAHVGVASRVDWQVRGVRGPKPKPPVGRVTE